MKVVALEGLTLRLVQEAPKEKWVLEHQAEECGDWKSLPLEAPACWATVQNTAIEAYKAGIIEGVKIVLEVIKDANNE